MIFGRKLDDIKRLKKQLAKELKIKDLGEVKEVLNIHVRRNRGKRLIFLSQPLYIQTILERFSMTSCHTVATPMEQGTPKALDKAYIEAKAEDKPGIDRIIYQEAIGSLIHLMVSTRPDLAFSVGRLSRHCQYPTETP